MIRALVFDLCDTVVRTAGAQALLRVPGLEECDPAQLEDWFKRDGLFVDYERGQVDTQVFLRHFRDAWGVKTDLAQLRQLYEDLVVEEIAGMAGLLAEMDSTFALYALSNNNPLLWRGIRRVCTCLDHFEEIFLSHQIGALKPAAAAYEHVLAHSGYLASEVLLIDDNPVCVAAARQQGWGAVHFTSATQARDELRKTTDGQISA